MYYHVIYSYSGNGFFGGRGKKKGLGIAFYEISLGEFQVILRRPLLVPPRLV